MKFTVTIPANEVARVRAFMRKKTEPGINPDTGQPNPPLTNAELDAELKRSIARRIADDIQQEELLEEHERVFKAYTRVNPQID